MPKTISNTVAIKKQDAKIKKLEEELDHQEAAKKTLKKPIRKDIKLLIIKQQEYINIYKFKKYIDIIYIYGRTKFKASNI